MKLLSRTFIKLVLTLFVLQITVYKCLEKRGVLSTTISGKNEDKSSSKFVTFHLKNNPVERHRFLSLVFPPINSFIETGRKLSIIFFVGYHL